jgi:hypothetical protein
MSHETDGKSIVVVGGTIMNRLLWTVHPVFLITNVEDHIFISAKDGSNGDFRWLGSLKTIDLFQDKVKTLVRWQSY